jgi:hypothetical protein
LRISSAKGLFCGKSQPQRRAIEYGNCSRNA